MEIDTERKTVQLSVGELASFGHRPRPSAYDFDWINRAQIGQEWHKTAEKETRASHPEAVFEKAISADWLFKGWIFTIRGRIDQLLPGEAEWTIREIKSVNTPLPLSDDSLVKEYKDYLAQCAIYLRICRVLEEFRESTINAELVFYEIEYGTIQRVPIRKEQEAFLEEQLEKVLPYLEDRLGRKKKLREADFLPAFKTLRSGQRETVQKLESAIDRAKVTLFDAPTGFGKTGVILEQALKRLKQGRFERCIYLTSKSTGQIEVVDQLDRMAGDSLSFLQMRNRRELSIESSAHTCTGDSRCDQDLAEKWAQSGLQSHRLMEGGRFPLEHAKRLGAATGICPYALTRACLPYSDIWIGDFNYVFSPNSRSVFSDALGFDPKSTLLIIDEAHNLHDRAALALDIEIDVNDLYFLVDAFREAQASSRFIRLVEECINQIDQLSPEAELSHQQFYNLLDLTEDLIRFQEREHLNYDALAPFAWDYLSRFRALLRTFTEDTENWVHWAPSQGKLRANCLSPTQWVSERISEFGASILMSATLDPIDDIHEKCGLDPKVTTLVRGATPWRENAYQVAVDTRVDTRLKTRSSHFETTARTLASVSWSSSGKPVAAFFPSYRYAEAVHEYLSVVEPGIRASIQPRGASLREQEDFVQNALISNDLISFIIGSSYSEGIDELGGKIDLAVIVGPAISEMNFLQRKKMEHEGGIRNESAFRQVCIIPAIRRIHQAIGRLVRHPEHRAKILLHCTRFSQPIYHDLMNPEYQEGRNLRTGAELEDWLAAPFGD